MTKKHLPHQHHWMLAQRPDYCRTYDDGLSIRVHLQFRCVGDPPCGAQAEFIVDDCEARPWIEKTAESGYVHFKTLPGSGQQMEVWP